MIKVITIKCDDELQEAHDEYLKEKEVVIEDLEYLIATAPNRGIKYRLENILEFIKKGEI